MVSSLNDDVLCRDNILLFFFFHMKELRDFNNNNKIYSNSIAKFNMKSVYYLNELFIFCSSILFFFNYTIDYNNLSNNNYFNELSLSITLHLAGHFIFIITLAPKQLFTSLATLSLFFSTKMSIIIVVEFNLLYPLSWNSLFIVYRVIYIYVEESNINEKKIFFVFFAKKREEKRILRTVIKL